LAHLSARSKSDKLNSSQHNPSLPDGITLVHAASDDGLEDAREAALVGLISPQGPHRFARAGQHDQVPPVRRPHFSTNYLEYSIDTVLNLNTNRSILRTATRLSRIHAAMVGNFD
jgi:hypothetical protein